MPYDKHLLIDTFNILHAVKSNSVDYLDFRANVARKIHEIKTYLAPDNMVLGFDFGESDYRKSLDVEYKAHRKQIKGHGVRQHWTPMIIKELSEYNKTARFKGIEFDDIAACAAQEYGSKLTIATMDTDLWQLSELSNIYFIKHGQKVPAYGPIELIMLKVICGDKSDNIPQIRPKLGPKTYEKLWMPLASDMHKVLTYGSEEMVFQSLADDWTPEEIERIILNFKLVSLIGPHNCIMKNYKKELIQIFEY